jgi:hypothetical protein
MTRIEALYKKYPDFAKYLPAKVLADNFCPGRFLPNEPSFGFVTGRISKNGRVLGCRKITCRKCWNEEVEE